jgi:hypothetical protein
LGLMRIPLGGKGEMKMAVSCALLTLLLASSPNARDRLSDSEIIQAFLDCPEIIHAQQELAAGAETHAPKIVLYNSMCGFAGCQYAALVAQKFERRRADPFVRHLLGYVHVGTKGDIYMVQRVELVPYKELNRSDDAGGKR